MTFAILTFGFVSLSHFLPVSWTSSTLVCVIRENLGNYVRARRRCSGTLTCLEIRDGVLDLSVIFCFPWNCVANIISSCSGKCRSPLLVFFSWQATSNVSTTNSVQNHCRSLCVNGCLYGNCHLCSRSLAKLISWLVFQTPFLALWNLPLLKWFHLED